MSIDNTEEDAKKLAMDGKILYKIGTGTNSLYNFMYKTAISGLIYGAFYGDISSIKDYLNKINGIYHADKLVSMSTKGKYYEGYLYPNTEENSKLVKKIFNDVHVRNISPSKKESSIFTRIIVHKDEDILIQDMEKGIYVKSYTNVANLVDNYCKDFGEPSSFKIVFKNSVDELKTISDVSKCLTDASDKKQKLVNNYSSILSRYIELHINWRKNILTQKAKNIPNKKRPSTRSPVRIERNGGSSNAIIRNIEKRK